MIGVIGALFACKRREGAMQPVTMDNFVRAETDTYFAGIQTPNAAASGVYGASRFYTASVASGHGRQKLTLAAPAEERTSPRLVRWFAVISRVGSTRPREGE